MEEIVLKVEGMSCNHCKMSVEKALKTLQGVKTAEVDLGTNSAKVSFDPGQVDKNKLKEAIVEAGYEVVE